MSDYEIVRSGCHVHTGDHVSWPFETAVAKLQHHAIVVAQKGGDLLKVIHARSSSGESNSASFGSGSGSDKDSYVVVEETLDFSKTMQDGVLRRYIYEPSDCKEPPDVIQSAREKIGSFIYRPFRNNCEHFARECKTGTKESYQADKAEKVAGWSGAAVAAAAAVSSIVGIALSSPKN